MIADDVIYCTMSCLGGVWEIIPIAIEYDRSFRPKRIG